MVGGVGLRGKRWSVLDMLDFRGLSDSQVRDVKEVVAYIYIYNLWGMCVNWLEL